MSQDNVGYAYTSCYALIRSLLFLTIFVILHGGFLTAQETFQKRVFLNNLNGLIA